MSFATRTLSFLMGSMISGVEPPISRSEALGFVEAMWHDSELTESFEEVFSEAAFGLMSDGKEFSGQNALKIAVMLLSVGYQTASVLLTDPRAIFVTHCMTLAEMCFKSVKYAEQVWMSALTSGGIDSFTAGIMITSSRGIAGTCFQYGLVSTNPEMIPAPILLNSPRFNVPGFDVNTKPVNVIAEEIVPTEHPELPNAHPVPVPMEVPEAILGAGYVVDLGKGVRKPRPNAVPAATESKVVLRDGSALRPLGSGRRHSLFERPVAGVVQEEMREMPPGVPLPQTEYPHCQRVGDFFA